MSTPLETVVREQLVERHEKLEAAITVAGQNGEIQRLLHEVDEALAKLGEGTYGLCEACHEAIEPDRLLSDPLVEFCLDHLTAHQRTALQQDLDLAARIQRGLLPPQHFRTDGWESFYHYEAYGPVSGDYCDLVRTDDGTLYFVLGDVSGKGVAAGVMMSNLQAVFRTLISVGLPLPELMARASRVFCESTLPTLYATLVCGKAMPTGEVEICNAGHLPALLLHGREVTCLASTGLPVGVFCTEQFTANKVQLGAGDTLLLYTDGLSEAVGPQGVEYGRGRVEAVAEKYSTQSPEDLITSLITDVRRFQDGVPKVDDMTVLALRRNGSSE